MAYKILTIEPKKKIALIAHDNKKDDLLEWAKYNQPVLASTNCTQPAQPAGCWRQNSTCRLTSCKAARSVATSKLGPGSLTAPLILSSFFGTRWSPSRMIPM